MFSLRGRSLLITGGTGSLGKRFVATALERLELDRVERVELRGRHQRRHRCPQPAVPRSFHERKIALFSRLGISRDAVLRDNADEDGRYHDSSIYSLLRGDQP